MLKDQSAISPTSTVPKSYPCASTAISGGRSSPAPASQIATSDSSSSSEKIVTEPSKSPASAGSKVTLTSRDSPEANTKPSPKSVVKPSPATTMFSTVRSFPPTLEISKAQSADSETMTAPKS